jgi:hypothetical protein
MGRIGGALVDLASKKAGGSVEMWDDNPATVDLIGSARYAEVVARMAVDERLLPVTIGVYGEWGSGKSSVMRLAEQLLAKDNAWMYQGYDDTKAALMTKIIETLKAKRALSSKAKEKAKNLLTRVNWLRLTAVTLRHVVAPLAVSQATGAPPVLSAPSAADIGGIVAPPGDESASAVQTIEKLREEFSDLLKAAGVKTLVVFVDDLDRCVPIVVVDVLEAIKLFLSVEGTAFVIGADENTIKQAVAIRYPQREGVEAVSKIYLEKIVQVPVHLHALGEAEAETYLNLLFAQLHQEPSDFRLLAEAAADNRAKAPLRAALDYETIKFALDDRLTAEYASDLGLVARISPIICRHERGNPRQLKRFLNTMLVREELAEAHGLRLDLQILSKLMILEYYHTEPHYRQLFEWQVAGAGVARGLAALEAIAARAGEPAMEDVAVEAQQAGLAAQDVQPWLKNGDVRRWLRSEPSLADQDLEQYFFVARERLAKHKFEASALTRNAREILSLLLSKDGLERERGKGLALKLPESEVENLLTAACGMIAQAARASDLVAVLCDIAEGRGSLIPILIAGLRQVPDDALPASAPNRVRTLGVVHETYESSVSSYLRGLTNSANKRLKRAAQQALAAGTGEA